MAQNLGAAVAAATAQRIALICLGGGDPRHYSFADIDRLADGAAYRLSQSGLERGDRVAILSANRAEFLWAFLGAMRAGFVAVPVNTKLPAATIAAVLADSDAVGVRGAARGCGADRGRGSNPCAGACAGLCSSAARFHGGGAAAGRHQQD
jgi:acyl-CoA synthetase (AMP-forming)/AMP-acid ligase II